MYIATPHPHHAEWTIRAAEARKHILCEKPIGLNFAEAMAIVEAARANDVFLMEAFMYRCHPQAARIAEIVRSGRLGPIRAIAATFSFRGKQPRDPDSRLLSNVLGGGGIMDVGCYAVSMSRLIAGAARGLDRPAEPTDVRGFARIGDTRVDEWSSAVLRFDGDVLAQVACGVDVWQENTVRVYGADAMLHVPSPWFQGERESMFIERGRPGEGEREEIVVESPHNPYTLEADLVAECVAAGR